MKHTNIQNFFNYDQLNRSNTTKKCYLESLPCTLFFPNPSTKDLESFFETIERTTLTNLDKQTWAVIRLTLLEPVWLLSSSKLRMRTLIVEKLQTHPKFIQNILSECKNISLFQRSLPEQESLLFTLSALVRLSDTLLDQRQAIDEFLQNIEDCVQLAPREWQKFIDGANWLIEELQEDRGPLFDRLNRIATIDLPSAEPMNMIEQGIELWAQQIPEEEARRLHLEMQRFQHMLDTVFEEVNALNRNTTVVKSDSEKVDVDSSRKTQSLEK